MPDLCAVCSRRRWRQLLLQYCLHHRHLDITTEPADEPAAAVPAAAAPATADPAAAAPAAAVSQSVSMPAAVPDYFESRAWRVDGHIGQDEHAWTSANGRRQLGGMRGARHQPGGMLVAPNACVQVAKHGR